MVRWFSLFVLLFVASAANADIRCRTYPAGYQTCRDSGYVLRGRADSGGRQVWRDNRGTVIRGRTNSLGKTTYRDSDGNTILRCRKNSFGDTICR